MRQLPRAMSWGEAVIEAIKAGKRPEHAPDDIQAVRQFANELVQTRRVCDKLC